MKTIIKRLTLSLIIAAAVLSITTGCRNTATGAGKDIENMGEKIQEKTK